MTNREQLQLRSALKNVEKYEWLLRTYRQLKRPTIIDVMNLPLMDWDFYIEYYNDNKPLIIQEYYNSFWTLTDLKINIPDIEIEILHNRNNNLNYEEIKNKLKTTMLLHDYINMIQETESSNDFYMVAYNENQKHFKKLFEVLPQIKFLKDREGFIWLGPKGTVTPWHYDLTNNLLMQVIGKKKVLLIPSWDLPLINNQRHVFSDLIYRDEILNPVGNQPEILKVVLEPGDLLFIPVGWSHYVESLEHSLTITYTNFTKFNDFSQTFPGLHSMPK